MFLLAQTINQKSFVFAALLLLTLALLLRVITWRSSFSTILFFITLWLLIQLPSIQTWLIGKITDKLSKNLHAAIHIRHIDFSLFNKMTLEGALIEDRNKDTLLYAGGLNVQITDWFFRNNKADLQYIGLNDATIKLQRKDSVWNYQFLVDYFSSSKKDTSGSIELDLKKIVLSNIHFLKKDEWRGEDMELHLGSMQLDAKEINLSKKIATINSIEFAKPEFAITNYSGRRPPPDTTEEIIKNDPMHLRLNPAGWGISAKTINIRNGSFKDFKADGRQPSKYFDGTHILFYAVNADIKNIVLKKDTVTAQIALSTKERSGFEVKKLTAQVKMFPEAMEFSKMDLQTPKSRLKSFYAMRYKTFDDMSDYITKVNMEGDFDNAYIDSDDIGFFAPELKDWKKKIRITGSIKGPVANLSGKNVIIVAGRNTLLNGDIHLKGLPDIDNTFIEFRSNDFRTSYEDASAMIPKLKEINPPRLDRIDRFRFIGTFTGFIKDFVTKGSIETNLGDVVADVNMKFPAHKPTIYSGNISTDNFELGKFLDNANIGIVAFKGSVKGSGLLASTLNATLDGTIKKLEFNNYAYQNILVNGAIAKQKFNGKLISKDSNLNATLVGLIDYSEQKPKFDFNADIGRTDLRKLNLTKDSVEFNGKLRFNFTGNNIDNFIGTARVYEAGLYKNGQRISFDSLTLESSVVENSKTITVVSNEFDGAIAGEFSIKDLPDAFQTFLNKYYPAYIKPVKSKLSDQNFSFVVTTKKIDDYISFIDKNLNGFNNTTISGRINTKTNQLDMNADVPQFSYKNFSFLNSNLKGTGTYDSLLLETNIGEIYVNDSLHFPNTHIRLRSANDLSDVHIKTSASQTLNAADLDAQVLTSQTGVQIKFNQSTFDVNGKKWSIQKDGELSVNNDVLYASHLKIYSDDQQVMITTHPASAGKWNDVHIDLRKINIGDFTSYLVKSERFEGLLTGSGEITNPLSKQSGFNFSGQADQFRLNNDSVGKLDLSAGYDKTTGLVNAHVNSNNKNYHFDIKGIFNTIDSANASVPPINLTTDFSDTKIDLLEKYIGEVFSNVKGFATGQLQIVGAGDQLKYIGDIKLRDGQLKVIYTQCKYKIPSATVKLRDGYIDFGSFQIQDTLGNTGMVTHGKLMHHAFNDLAYDFAINTNKMLLLNTKATDNNQFYGKVIGRVNMTLKGPNDNMLMEIKGEPTDSSNIFLPLNTGRENSTADYLVWKVYGKEMRPQHDKKATSLTVKLDLTANNYANVYVIVDPLTGDVMKANGHGNLQIRVGTTENLSMSGRYEIDHGSYNFTFQSFIRKPFLFREGGDNYILWKGDPYDADINVEAVYEAENIRFSDLAFNSGATSGLGKNAGAVQQYRGPVLVIADLTEKLTHPKIEFQIELPPNSPLKNDADAAFIFSLIQDDPNELNKQVSFLLVFNSFGPLSNSNVAFDPTTAVSGVFVNSISGLISNQLSQQFSSIFQKVFNSKSLRVNFNPSVYNGNFTDTYSDQSKLTYDRTSLNLSIAQSFLNERLTFTFGSALDFGLSAQQVQASSFQFLPDITMEYKLTQDGRIAVSVFYRDSYNYLSTVNHTQNRSGTSISYRRSFDRIDELFKKKKKEKPKVIVPNDGTAQQLK